MLAFRRIVQASLVVCVSAACQGSDALVPNHGQLRISLAMTGLDADPDGAQVTVDGTTRGTVTPASPLVLGVDAGVHPVVLGDLAENCAVNGDSRHDVEVRKDNAADVAFDATCGAAWGAVEVSVTTEGDNPDADGYLVRVDGEEAQRIQTGATTSFSQMSGGAHTVYVQDVASNCVVAGGNEVTAVVVATGGPVRDTARVALTVECAAGNTGFDVTLVTSGPDAPPALHLVVCAYEQWDCLGPVYDGVVSANAAFQLDVPPGQYFAWLDQVPHSCHQTWSWDGGVIAGQRTPVRLEITCVEWVEFVATLTTTGDDRQEIVKVAWSDGVAWLESGVPARLTGLEGDQTIALQNIQENCRATSANPFTTTLVPGVPTEVQFTVDCRAYPVVNVSVTSSGSNIPAGYLLRFDPDLFDDYGLTMPVDADGIASTRVNLGSHEIWLDRVPANCAVSVNPIMLNPELGTTTDVAFAVTCR
jgi:hypothetical protein